MSEEEKVDQNICETENISASPNGIENVKSSVTSDETIQDNIDTNETEVVEKTIPPIPSFNQKAFYKEKPKLSVKKDDEDDVEEFDTDDEEENSSSEQKSSDQQNTIEQNLTKNYSYEGDKCIYTEPETGRKLVWNSLENKWCDYEEDKSKEEETTAQPSTTENNYGFENDTHTYTDPNDGSKYFWDRERNAWIPKIDDDFMARYQMSYGFVDNTSTPSTASKNIPDAPDPPKVSKQEKKAENKRKAQEPPNWFDVDEAHNTTVYISNLPSDVTMDEIRELTIKCGLLARDEKGKDKLKLYTDENGELKGDARCTYIKVESVNLALDILDGWQIRPGKTITVQRAKFQMKGDFNPSLKPKKKKKDKERQKKIQEKLLDWRPDRLRGEPLKCERVVIIKNLFSPEEFEKDVQLILDYQQDLRSECSKCGEVKKITIHDRHPEGVAQITFKEVEEAQACVQLMNGRWFSQRRLTAEIWDGKTKYKIKETDEQIEARLNKWDKFLEDQEELEEKNKKADEAKKVEAQSLINEEVEE